MGQIGVQIVRVSDFLERQPLQRLWRVAQQFAQRLVDLQPFPLRRNQRHADGGILQRIAKTGFAFDDVLFFLAEGVHHHRHRMRRD
ncbi:hypothetical protein D3C79_328310 [compost metagenome]